MLKDKLAAALLSVLVLGAIAFGQQGTTVIKDYNSNNRADVDSSHRVAVNANIATTDLSPTGPCLTADANCDGVVSPPGTVWHKEGLVETAYTVASGCTSNAPCVLEMYCYNESTTTDYWVQLYNAASPTVGTAIVLPVIVPFRQGVIVSTNSKWSTAITIAATTTSSGSTGAAASKIDCWGTKRGGS